MFHRTAILEDSGSAGLHVGFVSRFGEPSVQWAFMDAEGQLSGLGSMNQEVSFWGRSSAAASTTP